MFGHHPQIRRKDPCSCLEDIGRQCKPWLHFSTSTSRPVNMQQMQMMQRSLEVSWSFWKPVKQIYKYMYHINILLSYIYIFLHEILHQLMSSLNIWISNLLWQCSEKWPQQLQLDSLSITLGSCVWIRQTFNASETNGDQQDPDISNQVHG